MNGDQGGTTSTLEMDFRQEIFELRFHQKCLFNIEIVDVVVQGVVGSGLDRHHNDFFGKVKQGQIKTRISHHDFVCVYGLLGLFVRDEGTRPWKHCSVRVNLQGPSATRNEMKTLLSAKPGSASNRLLKVRIGNGRFHQVNVLDIKQVDAFLKARVQDDDAKKLAMDILGALVVGV